MLHQYGFKARGREKASGHAVPAPRSQILDQSGDDRAARDGGRSWRKPSEACRAREARQIAQRTSLPDDDRYERQRSPCGRRLQRKEPDIRALGDLVGVPRGVPPRHWPPSQSGRTVAPTIAHLKVRATYIKMCSANPQRLLATTL